MGLLTSIPGIGKKTAERLLVEMKDRLGVLALSRSDSGVSGTEAASLERPTQDAIDALISLGYKPQDAVQMIQRVHQGAPAASVDQLIKMALKGGLSQGGARR